jgi:hypothetical protein
LPILSVDCPSLAPSNPDDILESPSIEGIIAGHTGFAEGKDLFELAGVLFCPSFDFGEGGDIGKESEKDDAEDGGKGMIRAVFRAWIVDVFQTLGEDGERGDATHGMTPFKGKRL